MLLRGYRLHPWLGGEDQGLENSSDSWLSCHERNESVGTPKGCSLCRIPQGWLREACRNWRPYPASSVIAAARNANLVFCPFLPPLLPMRTVKIIVEKHADGYVAYPVGIEGIVVGQGGSFEKAMQDVKSALKFHVETFGPQVRQS